ncbi:hypothetical protein D3C77_536480 [compost metagenome]
MAFEIQPFCSHVLKGILAGLLLCLGNGELLYFVTLGINTLGQQRTGFSSPFSGCG